MYEWENIDFLDAGSLVELRDPRQFGWGFYSKDYSTPPGVGAFSWFESRDELLDYLVNMEPNIWAYGFNGVDQETFTRLKTTVQEILAEADLNKGLTDGLRRKISKEFDNGEISWRGNFSDLHKGDDAFSETLVHEFLDSDNNEEGKPTMVTDEQIPGFIEFCKGFGHE